MQDDSVAECENWERAFHEFLNAKHPRLLNIIDKQGDEEKRERLLYCIQEFLRQNEPYKLRTCVINLREKEDFNSTLTMINRISIEIRRYGDSDKRKRVSDKLDQYIESLNRSISLNAQGISVTDNSVTTGMRQQIVSGHNQDPRIVVSSNTTEILLDALKSLEETATRVIIVIDVCHWKDAQPHESVVAWLKTFISKLDTRAKGTQDCRFVVISHDVFRIYLGSKNVILQIDLDQFGVPASTAPVVLPLEPVNPGLPQVSVDSSNNGANNPSTTSGPTPDATTAAIPATPSTPNAAGSQPPAPLATPVPQPPTAPVPQPVSSANAPASPQAIPGSNAGAGATPPGSGGLLPTHLIRRWVQHNRRNIIVVCVLLLAVFLLVFALIYPRPGGGKPSTALDPAICKNSSTSTAGAPASSAPVLPSEIGSDGIGVVQGSKPGESIGISDGRYILDTNRSADELHWKRMAAAVATTDKSQAINYLQKAIKLDPTDAEAHIYLADFQLLQSKRSYSTAVVATTVTGAANDMAIGWADLQGAYIEQMENNSDSSVRPVYMLIANSGSDLRKVAQVAQQIVRVEENNATFMGVIGWPTSSESLAAIHILDSNNITMISPSASSDALNKAGKNFFRIVPPDSEQGKVAATYALNTLKRSRVLLLCDPTNPYSLTMARSFTYNFSTIQPGKIVFSLPYGADPTQDVQAKLTAIQELKPDLIYFTGDSQKFSALDNELVNLAGKTNAYIMGGDTLYDLAIKPDNAYRDIYFTTYAFPDMWNEEHVAPPVPFFKDYPAAFNSDISTGGSYLKNRPNSEPTVAYDASKTLIEGFQLANYNLAGLHDAILNRTSQGTKGFQGASGWINYDNGDENNSNPIDKVIVVLYVDACGVTGKTHLLDLSGSLQGSHRDDPFPAGNCT